MPDELQMTCNKRQFMLHDSREDDSHRIIVFAPEFCLEQLRKHKHWQADGTFKFAPKLFKQVYTIHVSDENGFSFPTVHAISTNKSTDTYMRLLEIVKAHVDLENTSNFDPLEFMCDFEIAAHDAVRPTFNETAIKSCFFHLCQSAKRYADQHGLRSILA
jgi:hypothetical protein